MTVAVIRFGGSNCDRDTVNALSALGIESTLVWHEDGLPAETSGVVLPGGFSYGDYLRAGAMAARSPVMQDVQNLAADGIPVLGICNGAQIGCEASLAPGTFTTNKSARFQCERVYIRVENAETPWTQAYDEGDVFEIPIAHGEGRFEITEERFAELEEHNHILFRYCTRDGRVTDEANPNGSVGNGAGIVGSEPHIAVMMPHPERVTLPDIGATPARMVLQGVG